MDTQYDLIVIGAGPGGYVAAIEAAKYGMKTAIVEKDKLGGTCLNRGCIPTKAIMHASELYREMLSGGQFGITAEAVRYDMGKIHLYKDEVVDKLRNGVATLMKKYKIDVYNDCASIGPGHEVLLKSSAIKLKGEKILIAAGTAPALPKIEGIGLDGVLTSDDMLGGFDRELHKLTIIGGGVIGMEFASIYSNLGCEVTVIEALDRILANMDKEIAQNLKMILKKRGVQIVAGASVKRIEKGSQGELVCTYETKSGSESTSSDAVLVAVGRSPETAKLFEAGVNLKMNGRFIAADEHYETSEPGIYAIGDIIGKIQLAHAASAQGICAAAHMAGREKPVEADIIPSCVYTDPEIACVGISADEAKEKGLDILSAKYLMTANGKTVLSGQERGFIKIVAERQSRKILGAQLMCARATDLIGEFVQAVASGLTVDDMGKAVRPHPTFCEAISEVCRDMNA